MIKVMRKLIVNTDDFGYSTGINRGIIKTHIDGIVTSTSVMVDAVAADESAKLAQYPKLSVGLHYVHNPNERIIDEIERQVSKFRGLLGKMPTHIDIHKTGNDNLLKVTVGKYAKDIGLGFRYSGDHVFIGSYIGSKTNGDVSITQLMKSLGEANGAINELMCHVGYVDDYVAEHSSYNILREAELRTLCSSEAREYVEKIGLKLVNWSDI